MQPSLRTFIATLLVCTQIVHSSPDNQQHQPKKYTDEQVTTAAKKALLSHMSFYCILASLSPVTQYIVIKAIGNISDTTYRVNNSTLLTMATVIVSAAATNKILSNCKIKTDQIHKTFLMFLLSAKLHETLNSMYRILWLKPTMSETTIFGLYRSFREELDDLYAEQADDTDDDNDENPQPKRTALNNTVANMFFKILSLGTIDTTTA